VAKDKYEISVWDDYPVAASGDVPAHYAERKLGVIGSNTITSTCRAYEPKLVEDINGTNTFTFKMYYRYKEVNEEYAEKVNPWISLLVNERKIKVYWKKKWYDFVIKGIQEDSSGKSITYTCKDLFINELSKTGFDIEFSNDLENNQGTILELGAKVLENTDWTLDTAGSDLLQQTTDEPVYEVTTSRSFEANNESTSSTTTIPTGKKILPFYSQITNRSTYLQFLYANSYTTETGTQLVVGADCYSTTVLYQKDEQTGDLNVYKNSIASGNLIFSIGADTTVSNNYRGTRLVRKQKSVFDPTSGKYCNIYQATDTVDGKYAAGETIYGYTDTKYTDPTLVNNIIVNSVDFKDTNGWLESGGMSWTLYPAFTAQTDTSTYDPKSYLRVTGGQGKGADGWVFNSCLRESASYFPDGFAIGQKYVFRIKVMSDNGAGNLPSGTYITDGSNIKPRIRTYMTSGSDYDPDDSSHDFFSVSTPTASDNWIEYIMTCTKSITRSQLYADNIGFFIRFLPSGAVYWIENVQFYPLVMGASGDTSVRINPGDLDTQSVAQQHYFYYNKSKYSAATSMDNVEPLYEGTTDMNDPNVVAQYNENFTKIRSISISKSNRFNILQTLAETFECWVRFRINHNENTGEILRNEDGTPQKYVTFKEEVGQETGIGFEYGIDLKTISRTIQSDQIVTKTIVSPNSNEFGINGFCTIARSIENYPRTNYILDFGYYISHALIDAAELNKDLYLSTGTGLHFYPELHNLNTAYDSEIEELASKKTELENQKAYKRMYEDYVLAMDQQLQSMLADMNALLGTSGKGIVHIGNRLKKQKDADKPWPELQAQYDAYFNIKNIREAYAGLVTKISNSIDILTQRIEQIKINQNATVALAAQLELAFYKKYSRYIQEGSWIDEKYMDDTLYYLDARSVAYTSSRPQVSYNISVIRISSIPEFESKVFYLGDIAYVIDREFFGYVYPNGVKTPYKEKVLVSEITSYFDTPEQDSFKVQNYKTQFEDLFQRITATTQALQYSNGEYAKAASVVNPDGTIKAETLQASIALNADLVYSAHNESIVQDSTGITVTNLENPNEITRITSGGIFISTDGGRSWKNAVRGEGVATQYLTAGAVNANQINIYDGEHATFRWDGAGINAYDVFGTDDSTGEIGVNLSKFVRFDHYGVYGIDGGNDGTSSYSPTSESQIWDDAQFGMTWQGFFVKNRYGTHYVEVSSINDIQVVDTVNDVARVKIGKLDDYGAFGMRLRDATGAITLETLDNGTLWLQNRLNIGTTPSAPALVGLGYLDEVTTPNQITVDYGQSPINLDTRNINSTESTASPHNRRIFDTSNKFVIWEDGTMYAQGGYFEGTIHATGGKIGNMTIEEITQSSYKVEITSDVGNIIRLGGGTATATLTAHLYESGTEVDPSNITRYQWYQDGAQVGTNSRTYTTSFTQVLTTVIGCEITY